MLRKILPLMAPRPTSTNPRLNFKNQRVIFKFKPPSLLSRRPPHPPLPLMTKLNTPHLPMVIQSSIIVPTRPLPQLVNNINVNQPPSFHVAAYAGENVHAYTTFIKNNLHLYLPRLLENHLTDDEFKTIISEMETKFGFKPAFNNLKQHFRQGKIVDPEIPDLNSAILLKLIWEKLKNLQDYSMFNHFNETLDQIGMTCIQGCSHRLFGDYIAICVD